MNVKKIVEKKFKDFKCNLINAWLKKHNITGYVINDDFSISTYRSVKLPRNLKCLPKIIQFNNVMGDFSCVDGDFVNMRGFPFKVNGDFLFKNNKIKNCKNMPENIGGSVDLSGNKLESLVGCPNISDGHLFVSGNKLTSLIGCPEIIKGSLDISSNLLVSLEYCPKRINGSLLANNNKITNLNYLPNLVQLDVELMNNSIENLKNTTNISSIHKDLFLANNPINNLNIKNVSVKYIIQIPKESIELNFKSNLTLNFKENEALKVYKITMDELEKINKLIILDKELKNKPINKSKINKI